MTLHSPLRNREVLLSYTTLNMGERSCGTGCGELGHFANKSPASSLQGIVLFDEADLYLPALSKPPTKEPMENLLKRARSAGLGLLLATQSPGDFDYKCKENLHAWFVGLVKEKTALGICRTCSASGNI